MALFTDFIIYQRPGKRHILGEENDGMEEHLVSDEESFLLIGERPGKINAYLL